MVVVNDNHLSTVPQSRSLYTQLNNSSPEQVVDHTNFVMDKQKNQHVPQEQRKERLNIAKYNKKKNCTRRYWEQSCESMGEKITTKSCIKVNADKNTVINKIRAEK